MPYRSPIRFWFCQKYLLRQAWIMPNPYSVDPCSFTPYFVSHSEMKRNNEFAFC